jgi:hypothetical protein
MTPGGPRLPAGYITLLSALLLLLMAGFSMRGKMAGMPEDKPNPRAKAADKSLSLHGMTPDAMPGA